jgi:hypothetical protein
MISKSGRAVGRGVMTIRAIVFMKTSLQTL